MGLDTRLIVDTNGRKIKGLGKYKELGFDGRSKVVYSWRNNWLITNALEDAGFLVFNGPDYWLVSFNEKEVRTTIRVLKYYYFTKEGQEEIYRHLDHRVSLGDKEGITELCNLLKHVNGKVNVKMEYSW